MVMEIIVGWAAKKLVHEDLGGFESGDAREGTDM